jgi:protein gp37
VIVGGESGAKATARPFRIEWAEEIVTACRAAGVPCFMKQLGTNPEAEGLALGTAGKGEDPELFPVNLRVRELPVLARAAG